MKKQDAEKCAQTLRENVKNLIDCLQLVLPDDERKDEQDYIDDTQEQMNDAFDVLNHLINFIFCNEDEIIWDKDRLNDSN